LLGSWDGRRLEGRRSLLVLCLLTQQVPEWHVKHIDLVADLCERHRPVETVFYGLDLGVVAVDRDEVEIPLGLAFDLNQLVGAK
jgi:hypothetical protein